MIPDEKYSAKRKADLIDNILSCTEIVSEAFDELTPEKRNKIRASVADVIAESETSLESILDVYRAGVPRFATKWRDLEEAKPAESRRAALEHILAEKYGSKLRGAE